MILLDSEYGNTLEHLIDEAISESLSGRDVSVCGLEVVATGDDEFIKIDLCYNSEEALSPRATISLVDLIKTSFLGVGESRPPVVYHNLPETIKIQA